MNLVIHQRGLSSLSAAFVQRVYDSLLILDSDYMELVLVPLSQTFLHPGWIARGWDEYSVKTVGNGVLVVIQQKMQS
jgi:hypothetical protein